MIESGNILAIEENLSRPDQKLYVIEIDEYIVIVPFVKDENEIFLKTASPSRKYTKWLKGGKISRFTKKGF